MLVNKKKIGRDALRLVWGTGALEISWLGKRIRFPQVWEWERVGVPEG